MTGTSTKQPAGFALPMALFALVVVGVLVTGGFYVARQESRIGVASERSAEAFYLAEQGISESLLAWSPTVMNAIPLWTTRTLADTTDAGIWNVDVTRMAERMFFLDASGTLTRGGPVYSGATRRMGLIARIYTLDFEPPAALTTRGPTTIKGTAEVRGEDKVPAGWGSLCTKPPRNKPGIMSNDTSQVSANGKGNVSGNPPIDEDPTISDSTFTQFGDLSWAELIAMANKTLPGGSITQTGPVVVGGQCNYSALLNWGEPQDPSNPCYGYFPVIYVAGDARIESGGVGQGILLVDGTLDLRGNFVFHGIVIVQGSFETQGSGNRVYGGVMASNAEFDSQSLVGGSVVENSTCAVERAILNNAATSRPRPLTRRSWVDLSAVGS